MIGLRFFSNVFINSDIIWHSGSRTNVSRDSRTRRHMWIEFVVGSRPCFDGFSPGSPIFLPPQKPTFLNFNSIGNSRATGLSVEHCCVSPSLKQSWFIYFYFIWCCVRNLPIADSIFSSANFLLLYITLYKMFSAFIVITVRNSPPWLTIWFYDVFPQKWNVR